MKKKTVNCECDRKGRRESMTHKNTNSFRNSFTFDSIEFGKPIECGREREQVLTRHLEIQYVHTIGESIANSTGSRSSKNMKCHFYFSLAKCVFHFSIRLYNRVIHSSVNEIDHDSIFRSMELEYLYVYIDEPKIAMT